jgi:hypothetical protein
MKRNAAREQAQRPGTLEAMSTASPLKRKVLVPKLIISVPLEVGVDNWFTLSAKVRVQRPGYLKEVMVAACLDDQRTAEQLRIRKNPRRPFFIQRVHFVGDLAQLKVLPQLALCAALPEPDKDPG